jgi:protein-S-isoprenylcysteine O-methyltransferase Ste14
MKGKLGEYLSYSLNVVTFILYFVFLFTLDDPPNLAILNYFGFAFFALGAVFLVMSLVGHSRKENQATILAGGAYGIVRHPMYLSAILFFIAMACFLPHWIILILVCLNLIVIYRFMLIEEKQSIEKFGDAYRQYMYEVPRINFIVGLIRWFRRNREG